MATKIVNKLLPTTMVGSYPRPQWFRHQLLGRDVRVAFKEVQHEEAYHDAVATVIRDQEDAGLDIVTDGNMWYDDYVGVIGSFLGGAVASALGLRVHSGAESWIVAVIGAVSLVGILRALGVFSKRPAWR